MKTVTYSPSRIRITRFVLSSTDIFLFFQHQMSTLNSYFNTRKSRSSRQAKNVSKKEGTILSHFAAQAPQPEYDEVKKQPLPIVTTKPKTKQENKSSILYYLSPITRSTPKETISQEIEIVETIIPCQIRSVIPVSSFWNHILQEYDPESQTNQLTQDLTPVSSPKISNKAEVQVESMEISPVNKALRRRRLEEECDNIIRVSYYSIKGNLFPLLLTFFLFELECPYSYKTNRVLFGRLLIGRYSRGSLEAIKITIFFTTNQYNYYGHFR